MGGIQQGDVSKGWYQCLRAGISGKIAFDFWTKSTFLLSDATCPDVGDHGVWRTLTTRNDVRGAVVLKLTRSFERDGGNGTVCTMKTLLQGDFAIPTSTLASARGDRRPYLQRGSCSKVLARCCAVVAALARNNRCSSVDVGRLCGARRWPFWRILRGENNSDLSVHSFANSIVTEISDLSLSQTKIRASLLAEMRHGQGNVPSADLLTQRQRQ